MASRDVGFTPGDAFWSLANDRTLLLAQAGEWALGAAVYREMADFSVEEGRDWRTVARLAVESTLRAMSAYTDPAEVMVVVGCDCGSCERGLVVAFQDALESPPIPHPDCGEPPCSCWLMERRHAERSGSGTAL